MCAHVVFINLPGPGGGKGRPWSPSGTSLYGRRLLTGPWQACSKPALPRASCPLLTQFVTPEAGPAGLKSLCRCHCQEPALPRPGSSLRPFPQSSVTTCSLLCTSWVCLTQRLPVSLAGLCHFLLLGGPRLSVPLPRTGPCPGRDPPQDGSRQTERNEGAGLWRPQHTKS